MHIIGICGASCSGKTTLAGALARKISGNCYILQQDCYYVDHPDMTMAQLDRINYDDPASFEFGVLKADLNAWLRGESIHEKGYDYTIHRRADTGRILPPPDIVLLEGIHSFYDAELRGLMSLKIFVQVDPDVCILRRLRRDIKERARTVESVERQYLETVKPMLDHHIRHYVDYADIIVPAAGNNRHAIEMISDYINKL